VVLNVCGKHLKGIVSRPFVAGTVAGVGAEQLQMNPRALVGELLELVTTD